jgi:hypothetical protein
LVRSNWLHAWMSKLAVFQFFSNKWYINMLHHLSVSRYVLLVGYTAIWLVDRYILEQLGVWKNAILVSKDTLAFDINTADVYHSQVSTTNISNVHFLARFYTWSIWHWVRTSSLHLVPLANEAVSSSFRRQLVYWKVTLWVNNLFWRALNTGYIPMMISTLVYLILLGFGIMFFMNN